MKEVHRAIHRFYLFSFTLVWNSSP